jgi:hypothetical protein
MRKKFLNRRTFLGGAAVAVGLPFLDAMVPAFRTTAKAGADAPRRIVFIHVPNGIIRTNFTPRTEGDAYTLPSQLSALADIRGDLTIPTGISNKPGGGSYTYPDGTVSNDGPGDHARDVGTFLTCARLRKTDGTDIRNGISVDQVAANYLRSITPEIPSLELATRSGGYGGDSGYAPIYQSGISWANETTPLPKEIDPRAVFNRLFSGFDGGASLAEAERRQRLDQGVLDYALDDIDRLNGRLGPGDRIKLDEYLTGIRHLEVRLNSGALGPSCDPGEAPASTTNFEELVERMYDVITLAFQCDRTRVVTLMLSPGSYSFLGVSENHHQVSHLESLAGDVTKIETINRWQIESFGRLVRRLKLASDVDGTVLDNSIVLFGGGLDGTGHANGDGDLRPQASGPVHRHTYLPLLLAGRGGGMIRPGRHIVYRDDPPVANLYLTMLHSVGAMEETFGIEGTEPLSGLV